jgi:hypothetical protein
MRHGLLGTLLTDSDPVSVPEVVIRYMAEQLGIADWSCAKLYPERLQTQYEHAWEIRDLLGYRGREFPVRLSVTDPICGIL